jgi:hypothetical protein
MMDELSEIGRSELMMRLGGNLREPYRLKAFWTWMEGDWVVETDSAILAIYLKKA